jgi:hypothetical protein
MEDGGQKSSAISPLFSCASSPVVCGIGCRSGTLLLRRPGDKREILFGQTSALIDYGENRFGQESDRTGLTFGTGPPSTSSGQALRQAPTARRGRQGRLSTPWGDGSLLQFSNAGDSYGIGQPALKRVIRVETLSKSAKALFPPHKCGGSHRSFGRV